MTTTTQKQQIGILSTATTTTLQYFPIPQPGSGEVQIRNVAVASNPKDWKHPEFIKDYASIEGNDVAGIVEAVGDGVSEFKVGDRVAAFSKMDTQDIKFGAYAEFTCALEENTFPIGPNTPFEDAATLPLACMTAAIGLFRSLGVPETPSSGLANQQDDNAIIINGASSSIGSYAVQLAKRAGFYVIGIAGASKNLATSLGADVVIDYREGDLESALVEAVGSRHAEFAYDAVSAHGSIPLLARVLDKVSNTGKGNVTHVRPLTVNDRAQKPKGVVTSHTYIASAYGKDIQFAKKYFRLIGKWVEDGSPKPSRIRLMPRGLASVEEGSRALRAGQLSGEKLVYRISDTPGWANAAP